MTKVNVTPRDVRDSFGVIEPKMKSADWAKALDVTVMDPDGWDRRDFENSWAKEITSKEFHSRLATSTYAKNEDLRNTGWNI